MKRFIIEQPETEITSNSGLALVGAAINNQTNLSQEIDAIDLRRGIPHSDIIKSYLGVLCIGKNDFESIYQFQSDCFFQSALDIEKIEVMMLTSLSNEILGRKKCLIG